MLRIDVNMIVTETVNISVDRIVIKLYIVNNFRGAD